jgi:hypothetical protein
MAAKVVTLPRRHRVAYVSRALNRKVIDDLRVIHDSMGRDAFDAAAANVVIAVCGILAHECGHDRLIRLLDLVEDVSRRLDESQAS